MLLATDVVVKRVGRARVCSDTLDLWTARHEK